MTAPQAMQSAASQATTTTGNTMSSVGTPSSWNFSQQITPKATQATRILWVYQHTRTLAACNQTDNILSCGRWFWSKICGEGACRPFNKLFEKGNIQTYRRLGGGLILRHLASMELCEMKARHFDARIHQKTIVEIRTHHATNTTLPILARTKKIRHKVAQPPLPQDISRKLTDK